MYRSRCCDPRSARATDGREWIIVDLAAGHHGYPFVEQRDEGSQQAGLRLASQAQQDEVVLREQGVDELRNDGIVVADDPLEQRRIAPQSPDQVLPDFVFGLFRWQE